MKSCKNGYHGPDCEDEQCQCYCHDDDEEKSFYLNNLPSNNKVICNYNLVDRLQITSGL